MAKSQGYSRVCLVEKASGGYCANLTKLVMIQLLAFMTLLPLYNLHFIPGSSFQLCLQNSRRVNE